jgi:hypothetical protein
MAPPHYARTLQMFEITLQHYSEVTIRTRMVSEGNFRYLPKYGEKKKRIMSFGSYEPNMEGFLT